MPFAYNGSTLPEALGPSFSVGLEDLGATSVVTVKGELDLTSAGVLDSAMATALAGAPEVVLLDLSQTTFIGSFGMRWVIAAERRSVRHGARVYIAPAAPAVHRVFVICGLDAVLPFLSQDDVPQGAGRRREV